MLKTTGRRLVALSVGLTLSACADDDSGHDGEPAATTDDAGDSATGTSAGDPTTTDALEGSASVGADDDTTGQPPEPNDSGDSSEAPDSGDAETGAPEEIEWEFEPVYGVPNLDDDDGDGQSDWAQLALDAADDDLSALPLPAVPEGHSLRLSLAGDTDRTRIWHAQTLALGAGQDESLPEVYETSLPADEATELRVEFGDDYTDATLTLVLLDAAGQEVARAEAPLRASPTMLNHHLQPSEQVWVVDFTVSGWGSNASMIATYQEVLGSQFTAVPAPSYGYDVWIQDEFQFATSTGAQGQRLDTVIDSIRDRGLDDFAEDTLQGAGVSIRTWGNPFQATTWDSFGNLENSPPVTVDGVEYPFGRNYYGKSDDQGIHPAMAEYLVSQDIQAPVELDTFWLCVGHVDEFSSFVPDPDSPKGFKFVVSDVPAAYAVLEGLDPSTPLSLYGPDHGYATVEDLVSDVALRNLNLDLQADELDPIVERMRTEFGLEESDIVRMPSLFETVSGCGGGTAALIPGMVNLVVANRDDGESHLFIPDPFFRADVGDQTVDPFIEAFTDRLPPSLVPHYVDDWDVYHLALGEVHCGTNMTRTPIEDWWDVALHLLGGQ